MTSENSRRLDDGWAHLNVESASRSGGWLSYNTGISPRERALLLAIDAEEFPHLLVPCGPEERFATFEGGALQMHKGEFHFQGRAGSYLDISCKVAGLVDHFKTVVADVTDKAAESRWPASTAAGAVSEWRRLFAAAGTGPDLPLQRRLALFAELSTLLELSLVAGYLDAAWWTGPDRAPHDIEHPNLSVEVKAIGPESTFVHVHGLAQLDRLLAKPLLLVVRTVTESEEGETLSDLAARLVDGSTDRTAARTALFKAGLPTCRTGSEPRYAIAADLVVEVSEASPRLTTSMVGEVSPAISHVQYQVSLGPLAVQAASEPLTGVLRSYL